jgi:hypothetical protein
MERRRAFGRPEALLARRVFRRVARLQFPLVFRQRRAVALTRKRAVPAFLPRAERRSVPELILAWR